ncbi:MAG: hypothetical protein J5449_02845, partial [Oscillospiraceae bacterium]|nr:hypothetical protein [Oscillospiraceae bacterium]
GAPADYSNSRSVEINGMTCEVYRVDSPDVHTLSDLAAKLSKYVDESFVDTQLSQSELFYELDGVLYVYIAGRGDDLTIASVDYEAFMEPDGESGKVVATIHRQDYDDTAGEWKLTGNDDTYEFPFVLRDGHAVFSTMKYLY